MPAVTLQEILLNPEEYLSRKMNYGVFRGFVEYRLDPKKEGRVKVRVPQFHKGKNAISTRDLPWAQAMFPFNMFNVPDVGEVVFVVFEGGNTQYPLYISTSNNAFPRDRVSGVVDSTGTGNYLPDGERFPIAMGRRINKKGLDTPLESQVMQNYDPTRTTLGRSIKGHSIFFDDADQREVMNIIDRAGQVLSMMGQVSTGANEGNKKAREIGGSDIAYADTVANYARVLLSDLMSQALVLTSRKGDESILLKSNDEDSSGSAYGGSNRHMLELGAGQGHTVFEAVKGDEVKARISMDSNGSLVKIYTTGLLEFSADDIVVKGNLQIAGVLYTTIGDLVAEVKSLENTVNNLPTGGGGGSSLTRDDIIDIAGELVSDSTNLFTYDSDTNVLSYHSNPIRDIAGGLIGSLGDWSYTGGTLSYTFPDDHVRGLISAFITDDSILDLADPSRDSSDRGKFLGTSTTNENDLVLLDAPEGGVDQTARDAAAAAQSTADAATTPAEATTIADSRAAARYTNPEKSKLAGVEDNATANQKATNAQVDAESDDSAYMTVAKTFRAIARRVTDTIILNLAKATRTSSDRGKLLGVSSTDENDLVLVDASAGGAVTDVSVLNLAKMNRVASDRGRFLGVSDSDENDLVLIDAPSGTGGDSGGGTVHPPVTAFDVMYGNASATGMPGSVFTVRETTLTFNLFLPSTATAAPRWYITIPTGRQLQRVVNTAVGSVVDTDRWMRVSNTQTWYYSGPLFPSGVSYRGRFTIA